MRENALWKYRSCKIMEGDLSDGSKVYSVEIPGAVQLDCVSFSHALRLAAQIDLCSDVSPIDPELITCSNCGHCYHVSGDDTGLLCDLNDVCVSKYVPACIKFVEVIS